ncbi:MAG: DMT family transporter [Pseudomonadota bacterium]
MRLFLLCLITMMAFAANSLLNRAALAGGGIDEALFATIRLASGGAMLAILCWGLRGNLTLRGPARTVGVLALLVYMYGFSLAYNSLDAGIGALMLFALVQVTMFGFAVLSGEGVPARRWIGAVMALAGLTALLWPNTATQISLPHAASMGLAGIAWGAYSLAGKRAGDALQATAANFVLATPFGLVLWMVWPAPVPAIDATISGIALALTAGAITSGLGYAMWYSVLPKLSASAASVAQLSVPVLALLSGAMLLGETISLRAAISTAIVLCGIALSLAPARQENKRSSDR